MLGWLNNHLPSLLFLQRYVFGGSHTLASACEMSSVADGGLPGNFKPCSGWSFDLMLDAGLPYTRACDMLCFSCEALRTRASGLERTSKREGVEGGGRGRPPVRRG